MHDTATVIIEVIGIIVTLLTVVLGFYYFQKKHTLEVIQTRSDADVDKADATIKYAQARDVMIESYDKVVKMMTERDVIVQAQNVKIQNITQELSDARLSISRLSNRLDDETARSSKLQSEVDELTKRLDVEFQRRLVVEEERDGLRHQVSLLERKIQIQDTKVETKEEEKDK